MHGQKNIKLLSIFFGLIRSSISKTGFFFFCTYNRKLKGQSVMVSTKLSSILQWTTEDDGQCQGN